VADGPGRARTSSQAFWLGSGRIAAALVSAAWFVVLARSLSLDDFGSLALLLSLGLMMSIVTDLGLSGLLADAVALKPECARAATRVVIRKRLGLAAIASALTAILYVLAGGDGSWAVPAIFAVSTFASAVYSTFTAVFRAVGHAGYEGLNEFGSRVVVLGLGAAVLASGGGLIPVVTVYAVVDILSMVMLGWVFAASIDGQQHTAMPKLGLREARSLGAAGIVSMFYFRVDSWILAMIKGNEVVGRYAVAYRCFDALLIPALAVASLGIPHTAGLQGRQFRDKLLSLCGLSVAITIPFSVALVVGAEPFLDLAFGARYAVAADPLRVLAVGAVLTAATASLMPPLALRSARVAWVLLGSLTLNVVVNLIAIPSYGAMGAALATVGCELVLLIWLAFEVRAIGDRAPVALEVVPA
jgi:O-antigen/teichoic acid export membrane protein